MESKSKHLEDRLYLLLSELLTSLSLSYQFFQKITSLTIIHCYAEVLSIYQWETVSEWLKSYTLLEIVNSVSKASFASKNFAECILRILNKEGDWLHQSSHVNKLGVSCPSFMVGQFSSSSISGYRFVRLQALKDKQHQITFSGDNYMYNNFFCLVGVISLIIRW
mgnify:CR=1 FL=1